MTEATFWLIISLLNWNAAGDYEAIIEPAVVELSTRSEQEIFAFEEMLAMKLYALDTKAHAKEIGSGAYVDGEMYPHLDTFLYSRCAVVANGRIMYTAVLANPKLSHKDIDFEGVLYISSTAYERKTGKEFDYITKFSYETFSNEAGWQ